MQHPTLKGNIHRSLFQQEATVPPTRFQFNHGETVATEPNLYKQN